MQFAVFVAFAIVLGIPENGPPWLAEVPQRLGWLKSGWWMWTLVAGQMVAAGVTAGLYGQLVLRRLENEASWLPRAQERMSQAAYAARIVLVSGFLASTLLSDWVAWVCRIDVIARYWGLDELIVMLPFFVAVLVNWITLYPADRAIRQVALEQRLLAAVPARPVWRLSSYLSFNIRQHVLVIAVPMMPIVVANDFTLQYGRAMREATGIAWADQGVLVLIAGLVFLFAPMMLCHIWQTRPLPPGDLRQRLEELCRRTKLRYRRILIWETDNCVVNAAVMGLIKPFRYILLSDGMIEMMDDKSIEAVFGHEAGHVKHKHIEFYLLFAVLSMLIVGGITLAAGHWLQHNASEAMVRSGQIQDYLQIAGMVLIVLFWGIGFGIVSRRFEWQADLFGARSVTPSAEQCDHACVVHGTASADTAGGSGLCASAAMVFADALHRIASLNGIPIRANSWRHSSIANRMELLKSYVYRPSRSRRLERTVLLIKTILLGGTAIGLMIAIWLFWKTDPATRILELMGS